MKDTPEKNIPIGQIGTDKMAKVTKAKHTGIFEVTTQGNGSFQNQRGSPEMSVGGNGASCIMVDVKGIVARQRGIVLHWMTSQNGR